MFPKFWTLVVLNDSVCCGGCKGALVNNICTYCMWCPMLPWHVGKKGSDMYRLMDVVHIGWTVLSCIVSNHSSVDAFTLLLASGQQSNIILTDPYRWERLLKVRVTHLLKDSQLCVYNFSTFMLKVSNYKVFIFKKHCGGQKEWVGVGGIAG